MATHDYVIANGTGAAVRSDLNSALAAIVSQNSSATEPSPSYAYQRWADTSAGVMKMRNGANNAWITLYQLDGEWSTIAFENGTAAAPSIYFKDSGTDTGIYSPGADQVAISTGGTGRVFVSSTGLGVGTTPGYKLDVNGEVAFSPNTAGKNTFYFTTNASNDASLFLKSDTTNKVNIQANGTSYFNGGNVGIGTTSPGSFTPGNLVVEAATTAGITISDSTGGGTASIAFSATSSFQNKAKINCTMSSQSLEFSTAGSERARIDSSGRLLVGTSSSLGATAGQAAQKLQVAGSTDGGLTVGSFGADAFASNIDFFKSRSSTVGVNTIVQNNDALGKIYFSGADGSGYYPAATIESFVDGTPGSTDMPGRLVFSTTADGAASPTERMRINSAGGFKATTNGTSTSTTSATNEFYQSNNTETGLAIRCAGATFSDTAIAFNVDRNTTNNTYYFIRAGVTGVAYRFNVADSGNVTNTNNSYGAISDVKLKENIVDAGSQWADIKAFRVRKYNLKEDQKHTQIGGIAQEVELVSPGLVTESPDRDAEGNDLGTVTKSINYSVLYMKAVKALQEAMERIETLEARLTAAGIE